MQLYVEIPGVPMPVLSEVAPLGKDRELEYEIFFIDDSRFVNKTAYALKNARPSYSSLKNHGMNQKLLEKGFPEKVMDEAFGRLDNNIWRERAIWAEFMDCLPDKRDPGYKLPEGKDAVLYRGIEISTKGIDVAGAERIPVNVPKKPAPIDKEWKDALGANENTYHFPPDMDYFKKNRNGLTALLWIFKGREWPLLDSGKEPRVRGSSGGCLWGSVLSFDDIVEGFEP